MLLCVIVRGLSWFQYRKLRGGRAGGEGWREEREGSTMKVRGDGEEEEEFDPEQYKRDCEAEIQQYLDVVGRDSPEGKAILRDLEAGATPPRPTKADPEETQLIDLRLLVDSRIYRRHAPSSEELTALARSIKANGLKNPVEVRLVEGKFE